MTVHFDPDRTDHDRLYETYRRLRDEAPVYHLPGTDVWALSRFDDVQEALGLPEVFASSGVQEDQLLLPMLIFKEPKEHHPLRALVSRAFTPRRVDALEPRVRATVDELLDTFQGRDTADLMQEFALQLPNRIIAELIGIPDERRGEFLHWTEALIRVGPGAEVTIQKASAGIYSVFTTLLAERRTEPRDDLMSALLAAEVQGRQLSDEELLGFCFLLIVGGSDTTTNLIGNLAALLAEHPDQRDQLAADPTLIPNAIEETLRFESPTQNQPRRPVEPVERQGVTIPAGVRLLLVFGSANHDERVFDDPERFDVTREIEWHLAFGRGVHHCLGASLARMEARIGIGELLRRHPRFELAEKATWAPSRWARHHPALPLRLD